MVDTKRVSATTLKEFRNCEAKGLAIHSELFFTERTDAQLAGSYIDVALLSGDEKLREKVDGKFDTYYTKKGELKAMFRDAHKAIDRVSKDNYFMQFLEGDKQVVLETEIEGIPVKGIADVIDFDKKRIVDLKYLRSFADVWNEKTQSKENFIKAYGYDFQLAFYAMLAKQIYKTNFECYIAGVTKEKTIDYNIFELSEITLAQATAEVMIALERFTLVDEGLTPPQHCGRCDYCISTKRLNQSILV